MFHVDKIIKEMENGCTKPYEAKISKENGDQFYAIIKFKNNEQGVLTVINEIISYYLALSLEIVMPQSGVALVDELTDFGEFNIDNSNFGCCFYSKEIEKATVLNKNIMKFISNDDSYEKIILFDHIVYNKDRNKGNLLISSGKGDKILYVIDHTHVFKNQAIWDKYCLQQGMNENDYNDTEILDYNEYDYFFDCKIITYNSLLDIAQHFKKIINENLLDEIFTKIPSDWFISSKDLMVLKKYLIYRSSKLDDICLLINRYIESKKGGYNFEK